MLPVGLGSCHKRLSGLQTVATGHPATPVSQVTQTHQAYAPLCSSKLTIAPNLRAANARLSLAQAKKHKIVGGVFGMMVLERDQKAHGDWYSNTDKKLGRNHI